MLMILLLNTTNTRAANNVLHHVERISEQYGLHLNRDKCFYVAMNGDNTIKFRDGTRLKSLTEAKYLGRQMTHNMNVKHEFNCRMLQTLTTWYKLEPFWKAAVCSAKWKLEVYDAIIKNKLLYGLETIHLMQAMQEKFNTCQLRGLRKILTLQSTYMNRAQTNAYAMKKANQEINRNRTNNFRGIKLVSELVQQERCRLVGHILKAPPEDPLGQVSYLPNSAAAYPIIIQTTGWRAKAAMAL